MLRCIVSLKRRISRVPVPGYLSFQLLNYHTLGTGEDSVSSTSAPGARGNGEDSVKTALGIHGTGEDSDVSAPGARETGEELLMVVSALVRYPWDWRGLTISLCGSFTVNTSRCSS